jgi:hypothetical protein
MPTNAHFGHRQRDWSCQSPDAGAYLPSTAGAQCVDFWLKDSGGMDLDFPTILNKFDKLD